MRIVTYLDAGDHVVDFFDKGRLVLFEQVDGGWSRLASQPLEIHPELEMAYIKYELQAAVRALPPAEAFLARELRGVLRVFLEECGLHVWKSRGPLFAQLDDVARLEVERLHEESLAQAALPAPTNVGAPEEGVFRFDLAAILASGDCHASHDLLMPFLETTSFARLDVHCDHVPKWFAREFEELDLVIGSTIPEPSGNAITITILPKSALRTQPRGRRPGRSSCRCG